MDRQVLTAPEAPNRWPDGHATRVCHEPGTKRDPVVDVKVFFLCRLYVTRIVDN